MSGFGYTDIVSGAGMDPRNQPCNPAEDGVCEALECCKDQSLEDELRRLLEENIKLRGWLDEEAQAAGRLQRQVNNDTALLRQALEALEAAEFHAKRRIPDASIEVAVNGTIAALKERLK